MTVNKVKLCNIGQVITGKTPSTKHLEYYGGKIPFLTPSDDMDCKHSKSTRRSLTKQGASTVGRCIVPAGSISMSCIGTDLGKVVMLSTDCVTNQQINTIIPNESIVDRDYLYYSLVLLGQKLNQLSKTSTAVPIVNKTAFSNCEICLPGMDCQMAIAEVLSSIDAAIELNGQLNGYLAETIDALFKHEILDAIDDSWTQASLLDIANYKNGLAMQKFRPEGTDPGLPVLKIKELGQGRCATDAERCRSDIDESVHVYDGDLIFSWSGTLLLDFWAGGDAGLNQHLFKVTSENYSPWFYYLWTNYHMRKFIALAKDRATTMGHIKRTALAESEVYIPNESRIVELEKLFGPLVKEMVSSKIESRRLEELRDTLLPKLMSGEVDVRMGEVS